MQINVTGRHFTVTDSIKEYVRGKLLKLDRYFDKIIEAHIILSVEKYRHDVEITLVTKGNNIKVSAESEDMYASIDKAVDKIQRRLKRYSGRLKDHGPKLESYSSNNVLTERAGSLSEDSRPTLVSRRKSEMKPMSVDEAILQMGMTRTEFLVFRNAATNKVNVIYRRKDGNYGLIET